MLTLWILCLDWKLTNNLLVLNSETRKSTVFGQNPRLSAKNLQFLAKICGFYKICNFLPKIHGFYKIRSFLQKIRSFLPQNQSCLKMPEMDRSEVKNWGGGLFCHKNQSCSKLPEMDRSEVKNFSLILGGGGFSATKTKVA